MADERKPLGFEIVPTNSVVYSKFDPAAGKWGPLILSPVGDRTLWPSPMSAGINYGLAVFEGMKAFCHKSGKIFLFRPGDHAERFNQSLKGLLMPEFPKSEFLKALQMLVTVNAEFVPEYREGALYIRPIAWGNDKLGFAHNQNLSYTAAFWCSPVGNYYTDELKPISVYVMRDVTRAMPGGVGSYKTGGNYVISMLAQDIAKKNDCNDALFLDGKAKMFIEELGAANIFMVKKGILSTPQLLDTILPGITRKSIITLASSVFGFNVCERNISVKELVRADEVFATGTAAVITPIGRIKDGKKDYVIGSGQVGPITKKLYDLLTGIQYGDVEDQFGWLTKAVI